MKQLIYLLLSFSLLCSIPRSYASSDLVSKAEVCGSLSCENVFYFMRKFAKSGDLRAQTALGLMYLGGFGTSVDKGKGISQLIKAARAGYVFAQYRLGKIYSEGVFVKADKKIADYWLNKALGSKYYAEKPINIASKQPQENKLVITLQKTQTLTDLIVFMNPKYKLKLSEEERNKVVQDCTDCGLFAKISGIVGFFENRVPRKMYSGF